MANSTIDSPFHVERSTSISHQDPFRAPPGAAPNFGFTWNGVLDRGRATPKHSFHVKRGKLRCSRVGTPTITSKRTPASAIRTGFTLFHVKQLASARNLC